MFAKACEKARKFTHPMINSTKTVGGTLASTISTYFFISRDGWAISAAHAFNPFVQYQYDSKHIQEVKEIQEKDQKEGKVTEVQMKPEWITNHSVWFGADQIRMSKLSLVNNYDLAVFKLENVPPAFVEEIATLGDFDKLKIGTSLCKMGYPFIELKPLFEGNNFKLPVDANNLPVFPNDGIFTRTMYERRLNNDAPLKLLETSSPGLKGQSGGPVFDTNGIVYGMQLKTVHLPLGFAPTVMVEGKPTIENQFLNVGCALPSDTIQKVLLEMKIPFETVNKGSDGSTYIIN